MPLYRRLPKRGFNSLNKEKIAKLNLGNIQNFIDKNKINAQEKINIENLKKKKILNKSFTKIKILGNGEINIKIDVEANFASKTAFEKIEKTNGKLTLKK